MFRFGQQVGDGVAERTAACNLGAVLLAMKQPKLALEMLQRAIPPLNQKDGKSNGDLFYNFARGYLLLGNSTEAVKYFELALDEYKKESSPQMESDVALKAAQVYASLEKPFQEARCFGVASVAFGAQSSFHQQAECLCKQASIMAQQSALQEAITIAEDCLVLCERNASSVQSSKYHSQKQPVFVG